MAPSGQKLSTAIYPAVGALPEIENIAYGRIPWWATNKAGLNIFKYKTIEN